MKIILLKDVKKVGLKNHVQEVANGYAQFLIGQGKAEMATPAKIAKAEMQVAERVQKNESDKEALLAGLAKLKEGFLVIGANSNEKEHLFEAVSVETISAHIKDMVGCEVEASSVIIDSPIKELGEYTVKVVAGGKEIPVKVKIEAA